MRRREFIVLAAGAAYVWPIVVSAQSVSLPAIGFLNSGAANAFADRVAAFRQGLSETGYVEGKNISIEYRWANGNYDGLPKLATSALGLEFHAVKIGADRDFDAAFENLAQQHIDALVVPTDPYFNTKRKEIIHLAALHSLPTIYFDRSFVSDGGLISYGGRLTEAYHQIGLYTGRILKGEKASDLPVVQPTKFELVINLQTAKSLGLPVPQSLLVAADEVIE